MPKLKGTSGTLVIEIQDDGSLKTDARKVLGDEAEILELLQDLAMETGGSKEALKVEKHVGNHTHSHSHSHHHKAGQGGGGHSHG